MQNKKFAVVSISESYVYCLWSDFNETLNETSIGKVWGINHTKSNQPPRPTPKSLEIFYLWSDIRETLNVKSIDKIYIS